MFQLIPNPFGIVFVVNFVIHLAHIKCRSIKKGGIGGFQHMEQAYVQLDNFWLHVLYAFLFLVWPYYSVKYLNKSQYSYIYPIVFPPASLHA